SFATAFRAEPRASYRRVLGRGRRGSAAGGVLIRPFGVLDQIRGRERVTLDAEGLGWGELVGAVPPDEVVDRVGQAHRGLQVLALLRERVNQARQTAAPHPVREVLPLDVRGRDALGAPDD